MNIVISEGNDRVLALKLNWAQQLN